MEKKDKPPIFISFVKDEELDHEIFDFARMKETNGCLIAFDKDRKILGIGFTEYSHVLRGREIIEGKKEEKDEEIRYKNNEEDSFTYDELMEEFSGIKKKFEVERMSLKEIKQALIDDPELSDSERFEIYYENYQREKEMKK